MKFVNRKAWAIAFLIFCYLRLAGQALYGVLFHFYPVPLQEPIDVPFAPVYFVPMAAYEVIAIWAIMRLTLGISKAVTIQYSFFIGYASFNLIEEALFIPTHFDINEYWSLVVGIIFLSISLYRHARNQRAN